MHKWLTMDPFIVLSLSNMKLRNFYPTLDEMCDDLRIDRHTLEAKMKDIGYYYDASGNHFISKEAIKK